MQQGGEVEAVPDPAAAKGQGARGLWLSEKRQAGGPGESALSFGADAQLISVGAQRVSEGPRWAGRQEERTLTHRAPQGLYFDTTFSIQTVLKESHVPLGRDEGSGLCCLGAQPAIHR